VVRNIREPKAGARLGHGNSKWMGFLIAASARVTAASSPSKSLGYTPESRKLSESLHASLLPSLRSAGDFRDFVVGRLRGWPGC
jgi:hypothetical protein